MIPAALAYALSFVTALACAVLLTRAQRASRGRLLLWSAACFWGLALTNAVVFVDLVLLPGVDLYLVRLLTGLASTTVLLVGLVWESR